MNHWFSFVCFFIPDLKSYDQFRTHGFILILTKIDTNST